MGSGTSSGNETPRSVYRELFCNLPASAFLIDRRTLAILDCSDLARQEYGGGQHDLVGTNLLQLHVPEEERRASAVLQSGSNEFTYEANLLVSAGKVQLAEVRCRAVVCDGMPCLLVVLQPSLAAQPVQVTKQELQMISEQVPVIMWTVGPDLCFRSASGSGLTELAPNQRRAGQSLYEFFGVADETFPPILCHRKALNGESVQYELEHGGRMYETRLEPMRSENNEIIGVIGVAMDITEQRVMQAQLRHSEERNRALVENATDIIYTHDLRGNFTSVSPAAEQITGYTCEEAMRMNIAQVLAPEYLEIARNKIERKLQGEYVPPYEVEIITRGGTRVPVELSSRLVLRDGSPIAVQGIARDISERKRAERAVLESESRFRAVAETTASAIFIWVNHSIVYVNSAAERITGYSSDELAQLKLWEIVHPDFRELVRSRGIARQAGATDIPNRYEFKIITKNGEERWLDFMAGLIEYAGAPALLGTAFDITERRKAEQELQVQKTHLEELFESAPEGIIVLDSNARILSANREFLRMFGFLLSEVQGEVIESLIVPDWLQEEAEELSKILSAGEPFIIETVRRRRDGSLLDVSILAKPIAVAETTAAGSSIGRFVIYRDITEHRRAERFREAQLATTQVLSEAADLDHASNLLLGRLATTLGWDYARIWSATGHLRCEYAWSTAGSMPVESLLPASSTFDVAQRVASCSEPVWVTDIARSEFNLHGVAPITSVVAVPIRASSKVQFVLEFLSRTVRGADFELLKLLTDIGSQIGQFVDRRHAERALVESESKFRAVADTAASAIYIISDDRLLYVNRATELITGYTRDELLSMPASQIVHRDDVELLNERSRLQLEGHDLAPRVEFRIVTRSGETRWVDYSASVIQFEGELAVLVTAFDITDRKRAEQLQSALYRITSLASSAVELDELYRGIHEIVGELMYARNFYIALLDDEARLITFPYFVDELDPEPPPPQQRSRGLTDYVLRTGQTLFADPRVFEDLVAAGEVESRGAPSIDWLGVPLKSGEKTFGVLAVQSYSENIRYGIIERDILTFVSQQVARAIENKRQQEALARSEERYRSQVQSALYGLYRSSITGKFLDVNPALVAMLGYESADELYQLDLATELYVDPTERARLLEQIGRSEIISGVEAHWKKKNGKVITVRLSGRAGLRYAGEPQTFEMIAEDVTERRQLEEQLRHSQKMEAVGRLAGGVAHDFNNLLTVIKGYSDLLLSEVRSNEHLRGEVEEIRRAADRAADLTKQLLAFSRKQVLEPRVLNINAVVENLDRLLRRLIGDDVELFVCLSPDVGSVKADPGQLEQVLMNLAVNARDAMPSGGRLTIETHRVEIDEPSAAERNMPNPGVYVQLSVTDTGCGMDKETLSHIFEPFFTTKELGKGTGLGLSTAYGIVKQSGGHISAYSEVGHGTCFKVLLPCAEGAVNQSQKATTAPATLKTANETILLVEDEDGVRMLMKQVLQRGGYSILEARNGAEALLAAEQHPDEIHLLLTDVVLAHMSGREVARQIIANRPSAKVLFVSGYTEEAIIHHGVLDPGTAFLQKPFTPTSLARKVREVLDSSSSNAMAVSTSR